METIGGSVFSSLVDVALGAGGYSRDIATRLISVARRGSAHPWRERCLAILLLEDQLLRIGVEDWSEYAFLVAEIGLPQAAELGAGFGGTAGSEVVRELRARLARLDRVHWRVEASATEDGTRRYLARVAAEPTKLTLARWLFSPEEVAQEIVGALAVGCGAETLPAKIGGAAAARWTEQAMPALKFEKNIVERLCAERKTYWVTPACSQELNALVEYPLTSAAIAIKLPGSDLEIEIKRAGGRGAHLVDVISERNGLKAPVSHRLFGGSLGWLAEREAAAAGIFSKIFRLVHGGEAPCSETVQENALVTLPGAGGETHLLDYFSDGAVFGEGFEAAREGMRMCVETFPSDTGVRRASYGGPLGETLQFIGQALPEQAILLGSSSFRLDRLLLYLSDAGAEHYFREGLKVKYDAVDSQWLADTLLEEILGAVATRGVAFADYATYLRDVFAKGDNRARADENFLAVMEQIGTCWGTLLAVRGFSDGESFVLRNAGLRSCWRNGAWRIRIIFMDHDDLTVAGSRYPHLWPWREASGMGFDSIHILGGKMGEDWIPGEVGALKEIYRVDDLVGERGVNALRAAAREAYRKTQQALGTDAGLRALFRENFLVGVRDLDELVPGLLDAAPQDAEAIESWKAEARARLRAKGYEEELVAEYLRTIPHFREFFERVSFLYK